MKPPRKPRAPMMINSMRRHKPLLPDAALVIAHQLSQAAACDRILVMAAGRIIEQGDHASLVAAQGSYANLWAAWSVYNRPVPVQRVDPVPAGPRARVAIDKTA